MSDSYCRQVWRRQEGHSTSIFLVGVNWNCTSAMIKWPENNYWVTFIPGNDGWVLVLERGQINPYMTCTAENAGQISRSVFFEMARWAHQIFKRRMYAGYDALSEQEQDPQLSLF